MTNSPRWQIILNPLAGRRKGQNRLLTELPGILRSLGIAYDIRETGYARHATEIAREACDRGHRHFISAGGDGTHHEVVNGLMNRSDPELQPVLALLPVGTGNDWAHVHGIPRSSKEALSLIKSGKARHVPVGRIGFADGREVFFVNAVGLGLDAEVVSAISRDAVRSLGKIAYIIAAVKQLFRYRPVFASLQSATFKTRGSYATIHAGFGRFVGGGMEFLPHGDPYGSELALLTVQWASRSKLLFQMYRLFNGSIRRYAGAWYTHTSTVQITSDGQAPLLVEADGELRGTAPVHIDAMPAAIQVIVPSPT